MNVEKKRQREKATMRLMIRLYCHGHHHVRAAGAELCPKCAALAEYAAQKLDRCPRMKEKTFCSVCPIHCYAKEQRAAIQEIMRYAGPRMLLHHPLMALQHIFIQWRGR